nr:RNA polymerase factor sigma-54 [uncultured Roseateles sp.]
MGLQADHRQVQTLSPRLQHAVKLLQLSSLEFTQEVNQLMDSNPFLESEEGDPDIEADGLTEAEEAADDERDLWQAEGVASGRSGEGGERGDVSALDLIAMPGSLAQHLHGQLGVLSLPQRDGLLASAIIDSLDDDGYLRCELDELVAVTALSPPARRDELQIALRRVQSLDPAGVAARSLQECLLLQLPTLADAAQRELARRIVSEQLPALAARDVTGMARSLGCGPAEIEAVCGLIRRLDPRPGAGHGHQQIHYLVPDLIARKLRGSWTVQLNPSVVPRLRLNQGYAELFQRHRGAQDQAMASHLQDARWTLKNVAQRFSTILSVGEAIVRRQQRFLDYGVMAMKPMGLREIAEELGLHESTVSRVTNNKYIATPLGVFELKYFFSRAMTMASGNRCSGTALRGLVQDIISAEKPGAPLSDAAITRQLARQGLVVARRTVTKYRQLLHIAAVGRQGRPA